MCKTLIEKKKDLNPNLPFEEFEALANRQPNLKGNWIYKVTQPIYDGSLKYPYPKFDFDYSKENYFSSFELAEKFVKKQRKDIYCSWITQLPCDTAANGEIGAEWLYDQNGELVDYSITQGFFGKAEDFAFFGRPKNRQRFKEGDIVEVVNRKGIRLAVLVNTIPDVERCWNIYKNCQEKDSIPYFLDFSDDSATVIDGPNYVYHDHVGALQLMKPRFPIPEDISKDILTWKERCAKESESDWEKVHYTTWREERAKENGEHIGNFYELNIYLDFNEESLMPHLHINDLFGLRVALRIDKSEYYDHDMYTGRLTNNQLESLMEYLNETELEKTRWWYMIREWNENNDNPDLNLPLDTPLPNYLELKSKSNVTYR